MEEITNNFNSVTTLDDDYSNSDIINTIKFIEGISVDYMIIKFINTVECNGIIDQFQEYNYDVISDVHKNDKSRDKSERFSKTLMHFSEYKDIVGEEYKNEWVLYAYRYNGSGEIKCICSQHGLKHIYYIQNLRNYNILAVGSSCIEKFCCDSLRIFLNSNKSNIEKIFKKCEMCKKGKCISDIIDNICKSCYHDKNSKSPQYSEKYSLLYYDMDVSKACLSCYKIKKINYFKHRCNKCVDKGKEIISFDLELDTTEYNIVQCKFCKVAYKIIGNSIINGPCINCHNIINKPCSNYHDIKVLECYECCCILRETLTYKCKCSDLDKELVKHIQFSDITSDTFKIKYVGRSRFVFHELYINIYAKKCYTVDTSGLIHLNILVEQQYYKVIEAIQHKINNICNVSVEKIYFKTKCGNIYLKTKMDDNVVICRYNKFEREYNILQSEKDNPCIIVMSLRDINHSKNGKLYPNMYVKNVLFL